MRRVMDAQLVLLIYGFILFIVALKFLIDPKAVPKVAKDIADHHGLLHISGVLPLIFGVIILVGLGPGLMVNQIRLLAGIIGLFLVVQGLFRLLFAESWAHCLKKYAKHKHIHVKLGIMFMIGLLLMLIGLGFIPLK